MNATPTITCPHCKSPISLDEALTSQISSSVEETLRIEYQTKVATVQKETEAKIRKSLLEENQKNIVDLEEQLKEEKRRRKLSEEQELILRKKERELVERSEKMELEIERKMEEERKKIQEATESKLLEASRQKEMEKDKVISDLKKSLEDAQRKANQGSQQTQGEVRELMLEELLKSTFPSDLIEPIGKGVNGADIRQTVRSNGGTTCGVILWESKQTKVWSKDWIPKLKADLRAENADLCAIITAVFSEPNWSGMTQRDGVWISSVALVIPLATLLRKALLDTGYQKAVAAHRGTKAETLYDYITGTEFRQQLETLAEVFTEMNDQIQKERLVFEKQWKMREAQVHRLSLAATNMVGNIQGLAGQNTLAGITSLELPAD